MRPASFLSSLLLACSPLSGLGQQRCIEDRRKPSFRKVETLPKEKKTAGLLSFLCIVKIFCKTKTGNVLLSQAASHQVSSALRSLTTVFEMGTGVTSSLLSPDFLLVKFTYHCVATRSLRYSHTLVCSVPRNSCALCYANFPAQFLCFRTLAFAKSPAQFQYFVP